jgi:hypothetical protein
LPDNLRATALRFERKRHAARHELSVVSEEANEKMNEITSEI